uniref:PID domain-containing protein n=1 Tax=Syphacia muris TaxID=451379 RepID=A0A158R4C4_9BILA
MDLRQATLSNDPFRFQGDGVDFKGKLIGVRDVDEPRGDHMCAEAMRRAKLAVKTAGQHKQRIILNISIEGIKIKDEKKVTLYNFPVSRISFIARDTTDARAFGFIFSCSDNKYKFYGIKTAQTADKAVLSIRDMFQIVFEMKKAHLAEVKQKQEEHQNKTVALDDGVRMDNGVAVADLLDLETELQNIEQGVNQLQNIPAFVEDSWPNADGFGGSPNLPTAFTNTPFNDPFERQVADPFSSNGKSFTTTPPVPNPVSYQLPPSVPLQPSNPWSQLSAVHSAPNFQTNFSETNPFASSIVDPVDPFDTQSAHRVIESTTSFQKNCLQWPQNENSAPFPQNKDNKPHWHESRKVTSLEEAFTKLVDMDSLVSGPEIKKNPFDDLINPPKVPIGSMSTNGHPPHIPARTTAPLVFSGVNNDPFNDEFFS